jgi:hypothetical protein
LRKISISFRIYAFSGFSDIFPVDIGLQIHLLADLFPWKIPDLPPGKFHSGQCHPEKYLPEKCHPVNFYQLRGRKIGSNFSGAANEFVRMWANVIRANISSGKFHPGSGIK